MARSFPNNAAITTNVGVPSQCFPATLAAWVYITDTTVLRAAMIGMQVAAGWIVIGYWQATNQFYCGESDGSVVQNLQCSATALANQWVHLAGVFTSGTSRAVFMNGANKTTGSTSIGSNANTSAKVGQHTGTNYWQGNIAFPAAWNAALSDTDIAVLAKGISPYQVRPQSLVSFLKLGWGSPEPDFFGKRTWTVGTNVNVVANPRIFIP